MKMVPSVLCYLGKCTAGFSSNCVHTLSNLAAHEVAPSVSRRVYKWGGFPEIVHRPHRTMKTVHLFERLVTKVGSRGWLQSLSYAKLDQRKEIKTPAYVELES